ncbi:MAG: hypothetical protein V3W20_08170, partial [Candidatus Neomarinimicrobiota bacterium]
MTPTFIKLPITFRLTEESEMEKFKIAGYDQEQIDEQCEFEEGFIYVIVSGTDICDITSFNDAVKPNKTIVNRYNE